jgi:hypothetical protein
MNEMARNADQEMTKKLMSDYDYALYGNERVYRDRLNAMNEKIYNHGMKHNDYLNEANSKIRNDPFHLKNDFDFNRKLAEMKAYEKEAKKNDPNNMAERLRMVRQLFILAKRT